jgi:hypothetical protein
VSPAPWAAHFGLARTPFGKSIPAKDLFARQAHAEAIARISFCVVESALGVVTGDVGAGKTVALRAAVAGLDPTRHQVIYIANPSFGARGFYVTIVRALGDRPRHLKAELMAQASDLLAAEAESSRRAHPRLAAARAGPPPCTRPRPPGSASSPPRPGTAARPPSSAPAARLTSRPAPTPCCSKPSPRSPASSARPARIPAGKPDQATTPEHAQPGLPPDRQQDLPDRAHRTLPSHVQTAWPLTPRTHSQGSGLTDLFRICGHACEVAARPSVVST